MSLFLIAFFIVFCFACLFSIIKLAQQKRVQERNASINSFVLFAVFFIAKWIFSWPVPDYALLLTMVTLFINTFFGYYLNKYNTAKNFDRMLHCYGSFSFALFFYYIVQIIAPQALSVLFRGIFVFFLGMGLGAVFELIEFAIDKKYNTKTQRNLKDTDMDMFCNGIGSFAAAVLSCFIIR